MNGAHYKPRGAVQLVLLHQLSLERYPPAVNLLRTLHRQPGLATAVVTSTATDAPAVALPPDQPVWRLRFAVRADMLWRRWYLALLWHLRAALICWRLQPAVVISVEPHSALAAWIWLVLLRGRSRLLIHHHEYYSPADYLRPGNRLTRLNRWFENRLLRRAVWVSQTNADRLRLFQADHPELTAAQCRVLPNYPPRAWLQSLPAKTQWPRSATGPLRLVYVGSVSLHDTWIGPLVEWLNSPANTGCTLDVFCYNLDPATRSFLQSHSGTAVRFHAAGVAYDSLPQLLPQFDVGLILYRCNTVNFVWNASNKLFEYLLCGLDVWYPPCMLGVQPYARDTAAPRVLATDFENPGELNLAVRRDRTGLPWQPWTTTCEDAFEPLIACLFNTAPPDLPPRPRSPSP